VRNVSTGQVLAGTFTGHTRPVKSIVFSLDGQRIASASEDDAVRVWDATTGQLAAGPFTGHTDWALSASVTFSPDGQRIVSASSDGTSCVWDATTGHVIAGPFAGHTGWVSSVVFSPDGQRIASASDDGTIQVWDATTGQAVAGQSTGQVNWTRSVAFSPDGQHTSSASGDCANHVTNTVTEGSIFHFSDQSLINGDGWICGEEKELVLWIPDVYRRCLHRPSTVWVAGGHETRLDLSKFAHGSNWATVYDHTLLQ
jgi:WD40 repeat protein